MNICVECKHFKQSTYSELASHQCLHPDCRNPVSGRPMTCVEMRKAKAPCAPAGILWSKK